MSLQVLKSDTRPVIKHTKVKSFQVIFSGKPKQSPSQSPESTDSSSSSALNNKSNYCSWCYLGQQLPRATGTEKYAKYAGLCFKNIGYLRISTWNLVYWFLQVLCFFLIRPCTYLYGASDWKLNYVQTNLGISVLEQEMNDGGNGDRANIISRPERI